MTILDRLAEHARERVERSKAARPLSDLRREAESLPKGDFPFERALSGSALAFICECKKASPSKGLIAPDYPFTGIAADYEAAGADAVSVLTEPKWFLGSDEHLRRIAETVSIPCLRKDFTVDEYMLYKAKLLGAAAALLICSITESARLAEYISVCDSLGLSALVEAHDAAEIETALRAGARIVGVNNRDLKDFTVTPATPAASALSCRKAFSSSRRAASAPPGTRPRREGRAPTRCWWARRSCAPRTGARSSPN